jgi:uncharacterized tellurite resistance protein B-like protein
MNSFNIREKKIIIAILVAIMDADGIVHPNETAYLDSIIKAFDFNLNDLECVGEWDYSRIKQEFQLFADEKKQEAIRMFMEMAKCDGYADPRELKIIESLG